MILTDWGNQEETLLVWKFEVGWTITDLYESIYAAKRMIESKTYMVDVIIDLRRSIQIPDGIISAVIYAFETLPSNTGTTAIITTNTAWQMLYTIITNVYRVGFGLLQFVNTVDAAYSIVEHAQAERL